MKTKPAYFVINTESRRIRNVRQSWPSLEPGEIVIRAAFDIPDDRIPMIEEFVIEDLDSMAVAVQPVPVEE